MSDVIVVLGGNFPQVNDNRTRSLAQSELASLTGGEDRPEARTRAGRAWDSAVRAFNDISWRFNRVTQDITLVADTKTYSLSTDFRSPMRCHLVDSSSNTIRALGWIPYEQWVLAYPNQSTGGPEPSRYTAFNAHNQGTVTFDPFPTGTLTYPTVRIYYHRRIALAPGQEDKLNVPAEVDQAIFDLAEAIYTKRYLGMGKAAAMFALAQQSRFGVQSQHQDWPDYGAWGANG